MTTGNWHLVDAQRISEIRPYTFYKPSSEAISLLKPGHFVRAIFATNNRLHIEKMWLLITKISEDKYYGALNGYPKNFEGLEKNDEIVLEERHIIGIDSRLHDPIQPLITLYGALCTVSHQVLHEGQKVGYLCRTPPAEARDSGWWVFSGSEGIQYLANPDNFSVTTLGAVLNIDDRCKHLLESRVQSSFAFEEDTNAFESVHEKLPPITSGEAICLA